MNNMQHCVQQVMTKPWGRFFLWLTALTLLFHAQCIRADSSMIGRNIEKLSGIYSGYKGIFIGQCLYMLTNDGNLDIYDIQNPNSPVLLSNTPIYMYWANDLAIYGNRAYVAGGTREGDNIEPTIEIGLDIVDLKNPRAPVKLAEYKEQIHDHEIADQIVTDGHYAYLGGDWYEAIYQFDVSNPPYLYLAGEADYTDADNVTMDIPMGPIVLNGRFLYASTTDRLQIYDASATDPLKNKVSCNIPFYPYCIAVDGDQAYFIKNDVNYDTLVTSSTLSIYNLHDLKNPALISSTPIGTWGYKLLYRGGALYYSDDSSSTFLRMFDVSDPVHPACLADARFSDEKGWMTAGVDVSGSLISCGGYLLRYAPQGAVRVSGVNRAGCQVDYLRPRNLLYTNRTYEFAAPLPDPALKEVCYLQTSNDDKDQSGPDFLHFTIDRPATVYVAYDERYSAVPDWLAGWQKTGQRLLTTDSAGPGRALYARHFPAGPVTLGANRGDGQPTGYSMYSVILVPEKNAVRDWSLYY